MMKFDRNKNVAVMDDEHVWHSCHELRTWRFKIGHTHTQTRMLWNREEKNLIDSFNHNTATVVEEMRDGSCHEYYAE